MISIVIPTCKRNNLVPCLESIWKYTEGDYEIIVVANGYEGEIPLGVIPIKFKEKIGYPKACNAGIRQARGEFIVLLNDDTLLLPQEKNAWLNILRKPFYDKNMAMTGPWMMRNTEIDRPFLCFFCCMIRKSVLDKIGLLDEIFTWGYAEDVDLCCRAVDAGYNIAQVPTAGDIDYDGRFGIGQFPMYHEGNTTFANWPGGIELLNKNHAILRQRYGGVNIANAQKLGEWMSDPELMWLGTQARKSKVVIELGSWFGKSSMAIADNLPDNGVLYCIDTWAGSKAEVDTNHVQARDMDGDFAYNEFCKNLWMHIESGKLRTIRMHGKHAAKLLTKMGVKADFVFIDAGHLYDEVKEDIRSFTPLVKEGGILCGHDYARPEWTQVKDAVDELIGDVHCDADTIWWTRNVPVVKRNIYQCMMYNGEEEILKKNLDTMWDVVDRFVIIEAPVTHSGKPKPLYFQENMARFEQYLPKISHVIVDDSPKFDGTERRAWEIEAHQRDSMMKALGGCNDQDIIVVVDCDEIPNPGAVKNFSGEVSALLMDLYLFDYKVKAKEPWRHGKICPFWQLKAFTPTGIRYLEQVPNVTPCGEHLSYFGGTEKIRHKIESNAHLNVDKPEFKDEEHIQKCIEQGLDLFGRDIKYEVCA